MCIYIYLSTLNIHLPSSAMMFACTQVDIGTLATWPFLGEESVLVDWLLVPWRKQRCKYRHPTGHVVATCWQKIDETETAKKFETFFIVHQVVIKQIQNVLAIWAEPVLDHLSRFKEMGHSAQQISQNQYRVIVSHGIFYEGRHDVVFTGQPVLGRPHIEALSCLIGIPHFPGASLGSSSGAPSDAFSCESETLESFCTQRVIELVKKVETVSNKSSTCIAMLPVNHVLLRQLPVLIANIWGLTLDHTTYWVILYI